MSGAVELRPKDRAAWLELRRADITASQIAALLGEHPYFSAYQLWLEKSGQRQPLADLDSPAMRRGRLLEAVAVDMLREELPPEATVIHNEHHAYWRDEAARIGCTPDVLVEHPERGLGSVQIKNIEPSIYRHTWPDGEPPFWIVLQALTEAQLVGAKWAAVGALRVGFGIDFSLTEIPLHAGAWATLRQKAAEFWQAVEEGKALAPDYGRDGALIAAMNFASNGSATDLSGDNELVAGLHARESAKAKARELDKELERLDAMIRHKAGPHEMVIAGDYRVTLKPQEVAGYTVAPRVQRPIKVKHLTREKTL